jgi:hypothetical protein
MTELSRTVGVLDDLACTARGKKLRQETIAFMMCLLWWWLTGETNPPALRDQRVELVPYKPL